MKKFTRRIALYLAMLMVLFIFSGCTSTTSAPSTPASAPSSSSASAKASPEVPKDSTKPMKFTMSGGASGGSMHMILAMLGSKIEQKRPGSVITVMAGGLNSNPKLAGAGEIQFAITSTDIFPNAIAGKGYNAPIDLYGISRINTAGVFYFMVKKSTGLTSIDDMIAKKYPIKIVTFIKGQSPEITTQQVFGEYGITYEDIKSWGGKVEFMQWADAVSYCRDGNADALVGVTTLPSSFHTEFSTFADITLLPVKKEVVDSLCAKQHYDPIVIPAGSYKGVDKDVDSFGFQYLVFAGKDVSDEMAYTLTKSMYENVKAIREVHNAFKEFSTDIMADIPGPIHPGAEKFYKEVGLIK